MKLHALKHVCDSQGKDDSQQSKTEGSKPDNEGAKNNTVSRKQCASAKDTDSSDSSEDDSSDEDGNTRNDSGDAEVPLANLIPIHSPIIYGVSHTLHVYRITHFA